MKIRVTVKDIDYTSIIQLIGNKSISGFLGMINGNAIDKFAVSAVNFAHNAIAATLTNILKKEEINVTINDVSAALADESIISLTAEISELDIPSVAAYIMPEIAKIIKNNARLSFLAEIFDYYPDAALDAVNAVIKKIPASEQENLIANGIDSFKDKLIKTLSSALEKNNITMEITDIQVI